MSVSINFLLILFINFDCDFSYTFFGFLLKNFYEAKSHIFDFHFSYTFFWFFFKNSLSDKFSKLVPLINGKYQRNEH